MSVSSVGSRTDAYTAQFIKNCVKNADDLIKNGTPSFPQSYANIDVFTASWASGIGIAPNAGLRQMAQGIAGLDGDNSSFSKCEIAAWILTAQEVAAGLGGNTAQGQNGVVEFMRSAARGDTPTILKIQANYQRVKDFCCKDENPPAPPPVCPPETSRSTISSSLAATGSTASLPSSAAATGASSTAVSKLISSLRQSIS